MLLNQLIHIIGAKVERWIFKIKILMQEVAKCEQVWVRSNNYLKYLIDTEILQIRNKKLWIKLRKLKTLRIMVHQDYHRNHQAQKFKQLRKMQIWLKLHLGIVQEETNSKVQILIILEICQLVAKMSLVASFFIIKVKLQTILNKLAEIRWKHQDRLVLVVIHYKIHNKMKVGKICFLVLNTWSTLKKWNKIQAREIQ